MRSAAASMDLPVRIYPLYLPPLAKVMIFTIPSLFTVLGLLMVSGLIAEREPRLVGLVWLVVVGVFWYKVLTIPHRIEVLADGRATFVSIIRRLQLAPQEVESIKPAGNQVGFFILRHRSGKLLLVGQFDGFHEFLSNLEAANPRIELRGC